MGAYARASCLPRGVVFASLLYILVSAEESHGDVWSSRDCQVGSSQNSAYDIHTSEGDPAHAATDDWPDTPRNLRVLSNSKSDWRKSRWITVNISWEYPIDAAKRLKGFEIEVHKKNATRTWRRYFKVVPGRATNNAHLVRFHYSCVVGQFVIGAWYEYHVRVYSLPRPHSPLGDRYNSRIVRIVNPWKQEPTFWSPQLIAVANDSCNNEVRVDFTLAPLAFNFRNYSVCLKQQGMRMNRCLNYTVITADIRNDYAGVTLRNVLYGAYSVHVIPENPPIGNDCTCLESDPVTGTLFCTAGGCHFTRSAPFIVHNPASQQFCVSDGGGGAAGGGAARGGAGRHALQALVCLLAAGCVLVAGVAALLAVVCGRRAARAATGNASPASGSLYSLLRHDRAGSSDQRADVTAT